MIDLHCHSTASDGTCSPSELITLARNARLSAVALTDHDTTCGLTEFLSTAKEQNFDGIAGIELAGRNQHQQSFHILGLLIQPDHPELLAMTRQILCWRNERNRAIIAKMNQLGFAISLAEIEECCEGEVLGRPHIAQALIRKKSAGRSNRLLTRSSGGVAMLMSHGKCLLRKNAYGLSMPPEDWPSGRIPTPVTA